MIDLIKALLFSIGIIVSIITLVRMIILATKEGKTP
jgi:hypothetical protein